MGLWKTIVAAGAAAAAFRNTTLAFGGEDPLGEAPDEDNWHHEGLSRTALRADGFGPEAENVVAFHADYLDSYLYNPLWWMDVANGGGPDRIRVVMSSQADLVKLHFDDLFSSDEVQAMWRRYLSGTAAGLIWAGFDPNHDQAPRVAMAQNLLGASLHAIQDFYSHSNWIDDPCRRDRTWFEVGDGERRRMVLWTGSYELPHHLGIKPHGAYMFACTILNNLGAAGRRMMQMFCHAASPFAGSQLCTWIRDCTEAVVQTPPAIEVPGVGEVQPPEGILWVHPGINVDSRWQAPVGAAQRALDISGAEAFDIAYRLAARSSCQWLHLLGHVMGDAGLGEFWNLIRTAGVPRADYKTSTGPWEDFDALPYRFLTAGPYPPIDDASAWYLRLSIRTSDTDFAGTDADIVPIVDGRRLAALDHGVPPRPPGPGMAPSSTVPELVLGHNDFERGDRAAYVLGPFGAPPTTIELLNDAPDAGQVVMAALDDLWDGVVSAVQSLAATVRNLWGYDADFVDSDHRLLDAGLLEALVDGQARVFVLHCDGGSEGEYLVHGEVRPTGATGNFGNGVPWREYRVRFTQITCLRESQWDRFTPSDEPFVLALAIPHGGGQAVAKWRSEPFADVDSGETRAMSGDLVVRIPQRHGFISVACAVYESDDETPNDRDRLLDQFANQLAGSLEPVDRSFFETLGASIASAWRVDWVDVVTFNRDARVEVRLHGRQVFDRWVGAGESLTWTLQGAQVHTAHVPDVIACGCTTPCGGDLTGQGAP